MPRIESQKPIFIGIDPGKSGGIAVINDDVVLAFVMPKTVLELWDTINCVPTLNMGIKPMFALIEDVHSMPKQGVKSMFTFGMNVGQLHMALTAAAIPYDIVSPQRWIKSLNIPTTKKKAEGQWKKVLLAKAQRLFPNLPNWKEPKSQGRQESVADALLIAYYNQQTYNNR